jgi:hypothetical protein
MFLFGIVMFMTVYVSVFSDDYSLKPAEALDWFIHTRWTDMSLELPYHLSAIEPYGEEEVALAQNTIGIIYTMYLVWIFLFIAFNVTIISYPLSRVGKMAHAQSMDINKSDYAIALGTTTVVAIIYLGFTLQMFNKAIDEIIVASNKLAGTTVVANTHIDKLYGEMFNISLFSKDGIKKYDFFNDDTEETNEIL